MDQDYKLTAILNTGYEPVTFRLKGKPHFQIFLRIQSDQYDPELEKVTFVEYKLHHTFKNRVRVGTSQTNRFEVEIKAWGTFSVIIKVGQRDGEPYQFSQDIKEILEKKSV